MQFASSCGSQESVCRGETSKAMRLALCHWRSSKVLARKCLLNFWTKLQFSPLETGPKVGQRQKFGQYLYFTWVLLQQSASKYVIQVLANEEKNVFAHWHVGETSSSYEVTYRSFPEAALYKYHVVQSSSSVMGVTLSHRFSGTSETPNCMAQQKHFIFSYSYSCPFLHVQLP